MNPYIVPGIDISRLINAEIIEYFVCSIFVIDPERLKEKTRKHEVLIPRQTVYYLCRKYLTNGNKIPFHRLAEFVKINSQALEAFPCSLTGLLVAARQVLINNQVARLTLPLLSCLLS